MKKQIPILIAAVALAFVGGLLVRGWFVGGSRENGTTAADASRRQGPAFYTCSMHPQIQLTDPKAKCPLCGMDLIPVVSNGDGSSFAPELAMSERARKLAEVETAPVERKFVEARVRMVGRVEYDEGRLAYITAWVPGRLERLYVDYAGVPVKKGDHLVELYSPELLQAQEELITSIHTEDELKQSRSAYLRSRATASVDSAREKLRLWGLTEDQISEIEKRGAPQDRVTINTPISGVVVDKNAVEGMYVQTGLRIYTIADLSEVWVKLDAYESDLPWIHFGQEVEFRTEAYPGEVFKGQIAQIDDFLNAKTRTVKVRVNLPNPNGKLKPDMFVRAVVKSRVAQGGRVMDPGLAGKWISPMHPEIIKNEPGACDICGMDLVSAESLGYVAADDSQAPLVIPSSAPLITGKRAVVYVDVGSGRFEGREIELGPRAGDFYLVNSGLREGEQVVVKGNFKIDSAVQIQAKPSMMNPPAAGSTRAMEDQDITSAGDDLETFNAPDAFREQLMSLVLVYLRMQSDFSHDRSEQAADRAAPFKEALAEIDSSRLEDRAKKAWADRLEGLEKGIGAIGPASGMGEMREGFKEVSNALIAAVKQFGAGKGSPLYVYHCPMAFKGKGGDWLQAAEGTENPYYGSKMFDCGSLKETLTPAE